MNTRYEVYLIVGLLLFLAGCRSPDPLAPVAEISPVELTYVTLLDDEAAGNVELEMIAQFEAEHPQITISRQSYGRSPGAYLRSAAPPDIMLVPATYEVNEAIERGLVLDISLIWQEERFLDAYPTSLHTLGCCEGKHHFAPVGHTWSAIYYNREVFARYNLEPPETWDELMDISIVLQGQGVTPFAFPANDPWSLLMWFDYLVVRQHGPEFHADLMAGEVPYDDDRIREVFELWRNLLEEAYFAENVFALSLLRTYDQVIKGKAAMVLSSPVQMQMMPASWWDQLHFFPFPEFSPDIDTCEFAAAFGYLIPAKTAYPEEATTFLRYLTSASVQQIFFQHLDRTAGVVPGRLDIVETRLGSIAKEGRNLVHQADEVGQPFIFAEPEAMTPIAMTALRQFLRDPNDIDAVLEALETGRQRVFGE